MPLRLNYDEAGGVSLVGIDLDQQALDQAKENAEKLLVLMPHYLEKRDAWNLESPERFENSESSGSFDSAETFESFESFGADLEAYIFSRNLS